MAWATLDTRMYRGFMSVLDNPKLVPDRESARKAVLYAAQSVVGLTSSVGNYKLTIIHWLFIISIVKTCFLLTVL